MPVTFTDPKVELIVGPQLKIGEGGHTYWDQVQKEKGQVHGTNFPATPPGPTADSNPYINAQYYDLGLCLYNLYARSGDPAHQTLARKVCDSWWQFSPIGSGTTPIENSFAPRNVSLGGLMLRAIDGRPEMWDWIAKYTRYQFDSWIKRFWAGDALAYGVRDGSYMLLYATWLGKVHPDATLRASFLADAEKAAIDYYVRLQYPDGSWRWDDPDTPSAGGGTYVGVMQPFMVGLLLHALIDVYRATADEAIKGKIKTSVLACVNHLFDGGPFMKRNAGIPGSPIRWRAFNYFYHGGSTVNPTKYEQGDYNGVNAANVYDVEGARQPTSTLLHAFGWAYSVTGDTKYLGMADELYDSIFGFKEDQVSNYVAGGDPKGYNQHFRACGRLLAWRTGTATPPPDPLPPVVTVRKVAWPTGEARQNEILNTQWAQRYRMKRHLSGAWAEFELVN